MNKMKPILFNTEMVCAILDGCKSSTRRLIKPQPEGKVAHFTGFNTDYWAEEKKTPTGLVAVEMKRPFEVGDILYVREKWCLRYDGEKYFYFADKNTNREEPQLLDYDDVRWHPSIHMPKNAARLFLKVTAVKAERLQDFLCCRDEILKEGVSFDNYETATSQFKDLWNSTIRPEDAVVYGFDANPWVWAVEFERCEKPEEF